MDTDRTLGRRLGAAYLFVVAASLAAGLLAQARLAGPIEEVLADLATNPGPARAGAVIEVAATAAGIVVLATLLHAVVRWSSPIAARVAWGLWLIEATFMAAGAVGTLLLIDLAGGGRQETALATALAGFHDTAHAFHMVFFAIGALVWYALMYRAGTVPRWLAGFGLGAVALALVATVGGLIDLDLNQIAFGLPTGVFEITIGLWVIMRGVQMPRTPKGEPTRARPDLPVATG